MSTEVTSDMSDSDLDALIFDNVSEHDEGGSDIGNEVSTEEGTPDVSPTATSDEQTEGDAGSNDVDQTNAENEDSSDEATGSEGGEEDEKDTEGDDNESEAEDTDTQTTDNQDETDSKDTAKPTEKFQPLRAGGKEIPIDNLQELYTLASKAVGAQQKFNAIAPVRKAMMLGEKENVNLMDSVNFQINMKNDPRGTILNLLKENSIDPLDLDMEDAGKFQPKDFSPSDFEVGFDDVVGRIGNDPRYADTMDVVNNVWKDTGSRDALYKDPTIVEKLHQEMDPNNGIDGKSMYELVNPLAEKMYLMDNDGSKSKYEIYMKARQTKVKELEGLEKLRKDSETVVAKQKSKEKAKVESKKSKAKSTSGVSTGKQTVDFGKMSDAELDAFLAKTN